MEGRRTLDERQYFIAVLRSNEINSPQEASDDTMLPSEE
jgi:hypothetical protein